MEWFRLSLQLNNFPINRAEKLLQQIQEIPEQKYQEYLEEQRNSILKFHIENNTFYRQFCPKKNCKNWADVPVMKKTDLQQPLQNRLSKGYSSRKTTYVGKTSGSSGQPFIFAKDRFSHALSWAGFNNRYHWHGIDLNKSLQARFYGIPLDFYGNIQERVKDRISLRRRFNIFNLSDAKMQKFLQRFKRTKFEYINGYTSAILLFAKFLKNENIILKEICPSLKVCIVTSERLFENDKILMEETLGVPVLNEYGASEVGLIAFENPEKDWIVNSEDLYVEILDEKNNILPLGAEGRVVITSLYNKAHPMIRYDIGDTGILSETSTFKHPKLQKLIGRTNDIAHLANGKVVPGLTFYYVTKTIITDTGSIKEFVITQTALDSFKIEYVSENDFSENQIQKITSAIQRYVGKDLKVEFERKDTLQRSKSGKLKQFTSLI
ncbi:phenylacetate--CoA ligase family protein [Salegentibacter sp. F188]|uniref:Phenylacetate--CoA ligase family protein n=1 Tax=Autumnicola patrickiae TaxID=3075591 RepID=A0ABU3E0Y5_9FLAO|nr:phenylacetate--CoA ligase family protein [Salegentibacter sp. F188]MDT0689628.1 phenylacetate--CoA ligase family protein [Salegentibacter sp. F188]